MTNREKYAEQIIDMAAKDIKITVAHGAVATTAEKNLGHG